MNVLYHTLFSLFLYFPEDKTEYIPAAITSVIFLIAAILTMRFIIKYSRKEALKTKELEERMLKENHNQNDSVK
jgi:hypothetical protein